jgi:hypothetical protein
VGLAASVGSRGCALPVAWGVWPAQTTPAWRRLVRRLRPALPPGWLGLVWAERGGGSRAGSAPHPSGLASVGAPQHGGSGRPVQTVAPQPGTTWRGTGVPLTRPQGACTLVGRWEVGAAADATLPASPLLAGTAWCPGRPRPRRAPRLLRVRVLRQGGVALWVAWLRQAPFPAGPFVPAPWPAGPAWEAEPCAPERALPAAA